VPVAVAGVSSGFAQFIHQPQRLLAQRAHKRITRERNQAIEQIDSVIDHAIGAATPR